MMLRDYQAAVRRTCATTDPQETIKLALVGLQGELGDVAEPLKKTLWCGHPLDVAHLQEELGDVLWYLAILCNTLGLSLEQIIQGNLEKLQQRYPEGFSSGRSLARSEGEDSAQDWLVTETSEDSSDTDRLARLHVQLWHATSTALLLSLGRDLSAQGEPVRRVCFQVGLLLRVLARHHLTPLDVARTAMPAHKEVSHG